jgi:hypothetical protein
MRFKVMKSFTVLLSAGFLFSAPVAASPCEKEFAKPVEVGPELVGRFVWADQKEAVKARVLYPKSTVIKAGFEDERRALVVLESSTRCYAMLEGADLAERPGFEISGELNLAKLEFSQDRDLLLISSRTFNHSMEERSVLVVYAGGAVKSALKIVWSGLTYESSPAGEEIRYPFTVSGQHPMTLEYRAKGQVHPPIRFYFEQKTLTLRALD